MRGVNDRRLDEVRPDAAESASGEEFPERVCDKRPCRPATAFIIPSQSIFSFMLSSFLVWLWWLVVRFALCNLQMGRMGPVGRVRQLRALQIAFGASLGNFPLPFSTPCLEQ